MKISIITINFNNADGLRKTLDSVAEQTYQEFEHIIVDGGSTDASVDFIRDYERTIANRQSPISIIWSSEPDKGIYDAMNKGVARATGDYLLFLNGGDVMVSNSVICDVYPYLCESDFVIGRTYFSVNGIRVGQSPLLTEREMSMYYMYLKGINHQSAFIKRTLLRERPYDTSVKINADWLFFVQSIIFHSASVKFVNLFFVEFDQTGLSSNTQAVVEERKEVLQRILPERISRDYIQIVPYYYEVIRVQWLLRHPFCYKIYRAFTTLCRKLMGDK